MNARRATIPQDWQVKTLAELGGQVTSGSRGWAAYYADHGSLFVRITNLDRSNIHLDLSSSRFVQVEADDAEARRTRLSAGDLLVSITADIGIIGYIDEQVPKPAYINQHIARVRLDPKLVDSRFVAYYLASWEPQRRFVGSTDTGAKAGMNLTTVAALSTVVPPLAEQSRIADALTDIDDRVAHLQRMLAKKQAIKQGMMQQLLTAQTRLPGFTCEWDERRLDEISEKIQDGTHFSPELGGADFKYITSRNIGNGRLKLDTVETISADEHKKIYRRCDTRFGDLLLTKDGANTGNVAINTFREEISLLSSVAFIRADHQVAQEGYLLQYFQSEAGRRQISDAMSGNAITRLTLQKIRNLRIPLPSVQEQSSIAELLWNVDTETDTLCARLDKADAVKQGMMQELLTGRARLPVKENMT